MFITANSTVRYSTQFLRNTGQFAGDPAPTSCGPFARGQVDSDVDDARSVASVRWEDGNVSSVLALNLEVLTQGETATC